MSHKHVYGLKIERLPEHKLKIYEVPLKATPLPPLVDLRNKMPPIYDQGQTGSCTANALCALVQYINKSFMGSRLFLYYNERSLENTTAFDAGATMLSGIKSLIKFGLCLETDWPFIVSNLTVKPTPICYTNGLQHRVLSAKNIRNDILTMKTSLANGVPFVVGIAVYESFESPRVAQYGRVDMPQPKERFLGGHAVVCCGYDEKKQLWIMRNSWGPYWGLNGYFYLPYQYLLTPSLCSDLWCVLNFQA